MVRDRLRFTNTQRLPSPAMLTPSSVTAHVDGEEKTSEKMEEEILAFLQEVRGCREVPQRI